MHSLGKVVTTLATTYHHGLLAQVFVAGCRLLAWTPEGRVNQVIDSDCPLLTAYIALLCCCVASTELEQVGP